MRRKAWSGAGWLAVACLGLEACGEQDSGSAAPNPQRVAVAERAATALEMQAADERLAGLLGSQSRSDYYSRDLGDPVALLLEKLEHGETEPLKRAKEELSRGSEQTLVEVDRLLRRAFLDPALQPVVHNVMDVLAMVPADAPEPVLLRARASLLYALSNPRDAIRFLAARGLSLGKARPQDYELLLDHTAWESTEQLEVFLAALHSSDPERAELQFLDWIEAGSFPDCTAQMAGYAAESRSARVQQRAGMLFAAAPLGARSYLAAAAAKISAKGALETLQQECGAEDPARRDFAVQALGALGRPDEAAALLVADPELGVRSTALGSLKLCGDSPLARAALHSALGDGTRDIRVGALSLLASWGDEAAIDQALTLLEGSEGDLDLALRVLQPLWNERPELARRAFALLSAKLERERDRPLTEKLRWLQAIGLLPLEESARVLCSMLDTETPNIGKLRAHQWLMVQGANTGEAGRAYLAQRFTTETDPLRRLDLIFAVASQRCATNLGPCLTRDFLLQVLDDPSSSPYEVLYAADRLVRVGPSQLVAPRIKRATLRVTQPDVRLALQALLWRWY